MMLPRREPLAKVVVCEDNPATRELLCENLRADRFEALPAECAADALRHCHYHAPDLLLLDLMLPDAPGLDVLREIRDSHGTTGRYDPGLPVIVLSGRGDEVDRVRGLKEGADDYVVKPFSYSELSEKRRGSRGGRIRRSWVLLCGVGLALVAGVVGAWQLGVLSPAKQSGDEPSPHQKPVAKGGDVPGDTVERAAAQPTEGAELEEGAGEESPGSSKYELRPPNENNEELPVPAGATLCGNLDAGYAEFAAFHITAKGVSCEEAVELVITRLQQEPFGEWTCEEKWDEGMSPHTKCRKGGAVVEYD